MENELPEGLVEEVAVELHSVDTLGDRIPWGSMTPIGKKQREAYIKLARAALSVIAPHYEKQIAGLKAQIPQWLPISEMPDFPRFIVLNSGNAMVICSKDELNTMQGIFDATHFMHLPKPPTEITIE